MAKVIQMVQPHYDLPEDERFEALDAFWAAVDADPHAVILVEGLDDDVSGDIAVFSLLATAMEHARVLPTHGAVIIPKRIDEPDWGSGTSH